MVHYRYHKSPITCHHLKTNEFNPRYATASSPYLEHTFQFFLPFCPFLRNSLFVSGFLTKFSAHFPFQSNVPHDPPISPSFVSSSLLYVLRNNIHEFLMIKIILTSLYLLNYYTNHCTYTKFIKFTH